MRFFGAFAVLSTFVLSIGASGASAPALSDTKAQLHFHVNHAASTFTYERLNKTDAVLLVVDHQEGLYLLGRDKSAVEFKNNILAHASLGKVFGLPVVLTSSTDTGMHDDDLFTFGCADCEIGPNGPLTQEVLEMFPDAPFIRRQGEVNAWDNPDFKAAVEATGKSQVILAGITTDVRARIALTLEFDRIDPRVRSALRSWRCPCGMPDIACLLTAMPPERLTRSPLRTPTTACARPVSTSCPCSQLRWSSCATGATLLELQR